MNSKVGFYQPRGMGQPSQIHNILKAVQLLDEGLLEAAEMIQRSGYEWVLASKTGLKDAGTDAVLVATLKDKGGNIVRFFVLNRGDYLLCTGYAGLIPCRPAAFEAAFERAEPQEKGCVPPAMPRKEEA